MNIMFIINLELLKINDCHSKIVKPFNGVKWKVVLVGCICINGESLAQQTYDKPGTVSVRKFG